MYKLDCKDTGGVVGKPEMGTSKSSPKPITVPTSSAMGDTSSGPNLSAKYKSPNVTMEIAPKGMNQYE